MGDATRLNQVSFLIFAYSRPIKGPLAKQTNSYHRDFIVFIEKSLGACQVIMLRLA